jgi:hypothetical protein
MVTIKKRLKEARDQQKSYVDAKRTDRSYKEGNKFLLELDPLRVPSDLVREQNYPLGSLDHLRS